MGLGVDFVQSDSSHYKSFVCQICNSLADLDAVVAGKCNHAFCKSCMDVWVTRSSDCPSCDTSLKSDASKAACSSSCKRLRPDIDVFSLEKAQPLAHIVMGHIRISCPHCKVWDGSYGKLNEHVKTCSSHNNHINKLTGKEPQRGRVENRRKSMDAVAAAASASTSRPRRRASVDNGRDRSLSINSRSGDIFVDREDTSLDQLVLEGILEGSGEVEGENRHDSQEAVAEEWRTADRRARKQNQVVTEKEMNEAQVLKEKGNAKFNKQMYPEARQYYGQALKIVQGYQLSPQDSQIVASLYCNRAATFLKENKFSPSIQDCDSALQLVPDHLKAYTRKFRALASMGKLHDACDLLEVAVVKVSNNKGLKEDLKKTKHLIDLVDKVKRALRQQNYQEARQIGENLMKMTDNVEAVLLAAEADAACGHIASAKEKCGFALKSELKRSATWKTKAYVEMLAGNLDSAVGMFKESLGIDPNNSETKELYKLCRKLQKDLGEARNIMARVDRSRAGLKQASDLISVYVDEVTIPATAPLHSLMRTERGEAELELQHYQPALTDARFAIDAQQVNGRAWLLKTNAYISMGRAGDARDEAQNAVRTWAHDSDQVKACLATADFECKVQSMDKELRAMVAHIVPRSGGKKDGQEHNSLSKSDHHPQEANGKPARRSSIESQSPNNRRPNGAHPNRRRSSSSGPSAPPNQQRRPSPHGSHSPAPGGSHGPHNSHGSHSPAHDRRPGERRGSQNQLGPPKRMDRGRPNGGEHSRQHAPPAAADKSPPRRLTKRTPSMESELSRSNHSQLSSEGRNQTDRAPRRLTKRTPSMESDGRSRPMTEADARRRVSLI